MAKKGIDYLQLASRTISQEPMNMPHALHSMRKRPILTGIAMCGGHLPVQNGKREPADTPGLELDRYPRSYDSCKFTFFFPNIYRLWRSILAYCILKNILKHILASTSTTGLKDKHSQMTQRIKTCFFLTLKLARYMPDIMFR